MIIRIYAKCLHVHVMRVARLAHEYKHVYKYTIVVLVAHILINMPRLDHAERRQHIYQYILKLLESAD